VVDLGDDNDIILEMIFISYSAKDAKMAGDIKKELEISFCPCFVAHDDIPGGSDWHEKIWSELRACDIFIALVTKNFNSSAFCQQEVGAALALEKNSLFAICEDAPIPGFANRFQAVPSSKLIQTLNAEIKFRALRVESWIHANRNVGNFYGAKSIHDRFHNEWDSMTEDERIRWIVASKSNRQVRGEQYKTGPFLDARYREMKPLLTDAVLYEYDKGGVLHDIDSNPYALQNQSKAKGVAKHVP
jgi:TIR domain